MAGMELQNFNKSREWPKIKIDLKHKRRGQEIAEPRYRTGYQIFEGLGESEMAKAHRNHEEATAEMFQRDPELAADYLNSVLADGDETDLMLALRSLSKAFGGVQEIAKQAEVNAHTLYRTLSEQGNPELKTLSAILRAMGMRLAVQPINHIHA